MATGAQGCSGALRSPYLCCPGGLTPRPRPRSHPQAPLPKLGDLGAAPESKRRLPVQRRPPAVKQDTSFELDGAEVRLLALLRLQGRAPEAAHPARGAAGIHGPRGARASLQGEEKEPKVRQDHPVRHAQGTPVASRAAHARVALRSYASRKAYAEARPRVKGRFAKRGELAGEGEGGSTPSGSGVEAGGGGSGGSMPRGAAGGLADCFQDGGFGDIFGGGSMAPPLQSPLAWLQAQGASKEQSRA